MDGATNSNSEPFVTVDHQTPLAPIETIFRPLFSSDYTRKVDKTTDIAGRLPNAVYTLPPHLVQAIVGLAEVTYATRKTLVAECTKFYLADRQYEESKEVFVDTEDDESTTITLDCGRLYSEGDNRQGQCGIGSDEEEVTFPCPIRLSPVLQVWCGHYRWFAKTTRGLYAWGNGSLGLGDDDLNNQPRRVPIDIEVLTVYLTSDQSLFRTSSGWLGCGDNSYGQLALGHSCENVTTPALIPGSDGVTRLTGDVNVTFAFTDGGLLASGDNRYGQCGVGSTERHIPTLTPVALPYDVKGRVGRVVCDGGSSFFIAGRRCFVAGSNGDGRLGMWSKEAIIRTPTELHVPVDDVIIDFDEIWISIFDFCVTVIRSGNTLLACGDNRLRKVSTANTRKLTTLTTLSLPGPVVKVFVDCGFMFVQLTDGAWVGRGRYDSKYFAHIPEADLIIGFYLPGWTPVTDEIAEVLNAREAADNLMFLPEPITNS